MLIALLLAPLTIPQIVTKSPSLAGTSPSSPVWSADGSTLAFLWNDQAMPSRDVWLVNRDGSGLRRATTEGGVSEVAWSGREPVYIAGGFVSRAGTRLAAKAGAEGLGVSPDGRTLSFLRDGDLWLLDERGERQVTHVGKPPIAQVPLGRYNRRDAEIGGAAWGENNRYAWSPDGKTLAVHFVDRTQVRKFPIPWYLTDDAILNYLRRGAPGDVNERRTIGLCDVASGELKLLDLPNQTGMRIVNFGWSRDGALMIDRETDDSVDRSIVLTDARGTAPREIWHDHGENRIYNEVASVWAADGKSILMTGDLDDRYRLYSVPLDGSAPKMLTPGPSDVEGAAVPAGDEVYYVSTAPRPEERQVWSDGKQRTTRPGMHQPFPSPDGKVLALLSTDDVTPTELYIGDTRVTHSPPPAFAQHKWVRARYVHFPATGAGTAGVDLHARILEPRTPGRHPVVFGPVYINRVRNHWDARWALLEQLLVQRGYVVVQLDSRGSTGYGRAFREKFLFGWGNGDLDDYQDAVNYVRKLPDVDGRHIGITGSSYGGLITVFALLKKPG
ncbi:MAG TPA: DPP IV N-terminal domain-containing protein, partial [Myxococcales bacterium]|nr:DPP IV N-terminal domain-containing protein [Myxococcales bacterium]